MAIAKDSFGGTFLSARIVMAMGTEIAAGKNILNLAAGRNALIKARCSKLRHWLSGKGRMGQLIDKDSIFFLPFFRLSSQQGHNKTVLIEESGHQSLQVFNDAVRLFLKMRAQILEELVIGQLIMLAGAAGIGEITRKTDGGNGHAS